VQVYEYFPCDSETTDARASDQDAPQAETAEPVNPAMDPDPLRRDVDLCPKLAALLKAFVENRTSGFLFHNRKGNFLSLINLLRRGLHPGLEKLKQPKAGFHAPAATVLHGSERIASMLTWNDLDGT
jgi:hypothetical protein